MAILVERTSLLSCLPPELILNSLSHIDYAPGCFNDLRLVCRDFNKILLRFEHSLAVEIIRLQLPPGILAKHPGLQISETKIGFNTLDELCIRMCTLFRIERNCHNIRRREGKEAAWMRPEWINLHQAGMHLLYRLHDAGRFIYRSARVLDSHPTTGNHETKSQVIRSLPSTSLAILLLTLYLCIQQLRADGPTLLTPTSPLLHGMLRFEVELCCQELILENGPSFLDALLCHCPNAIALLESETRNMEARQLPSEDGKAREKTLIAECRCRLADLLGTNVEDSRGAMWSILERIGMLDEADIVKVIRGEDLVTRTRQDSGVGLYV